MSIRITPLDIFELYHILNTVNDGIDQIDSLVTDNIPTVVKNDVMNLSTR